MADYLWKELSEKEKEQIKTDAKKLILEFGARVEEIPEIKEVFVERDFDSRQEGGKSLKDEKFRKIMFENAPNKNQDFIVAEKGGWVDD
jgi:hypothetical protein